MKKRFASAMNDEFENPYTLPLNHDSRRPSRILGDSSNNIFTVVLPTEKLQTAFNRLVRMIEKQGLMDICIGNVFLVDFQNLNVRLHLGKKKKGQRGNNWTIRTE